MSQTTTITKSASVASKLPPSLLASFKPPATNKKIVSHKVLAENCGIGSSTGRAWVCVHGHVFDVTDFSKVHPGGPVIRLAAGKDAACLIESYHPGSSVSYVEAQLNKCPYIGSMAPNPSQPVSKRPDDAFFLDVRTRVEQLINSNSNRYAFDNIGVAEAAVTFILYVIAMYQVGVNGSWGWTAVLGLLTGRMGFLMHMGLHCAISKDVNRNKWVGLFMDLIGSNGTIWGYEHQVAHHVEPNEYHHDNDCEIGAPAVRMHPEVPYEATMKYQHIIIPIAMTIGFFKWYVGDFGHFIHKRVGNVAMAIDRNDWYQLLFFKALWFILHVVIPFYFCGWKLACVQCLFFMGLGGHYLENIFIVNHIQNGLVPPPDAHWANKQVMATSNWKSQSVFWNWVSGGLNHQVEHHMFPSLSHYWYPHIAKVVEQTCKDHGLPYRNYPNFSEAWIEMISYLRDMGDENFISRTGQHGAPRVEKTKAQ